MVQDVFALHNIVGSDEVTFPFSLRDYQRYVFGDDRLAHRFGTDLAKAFIPAMQPTTTDEFAVAVLSEHIPTATHSLRSHFVAYLNRYLIASNATPALKIDLHSVGTDAKARHGPAVNRKDAYHIDAERLGTRAIIVLADIRTSQDREDSIKKSFSQRGIKNRIVFSYLASLDGFATIAALSPFLSSVVSPSMREVESIAQGSNFIMNECFVRFALGKDDAEFCQFIRRQDDHFVRLLLDYAITGRYYDDEDHEHNVDFLLWEVEARESMYSD
jgi:hypothetical protein